ncbi:MAG: hypothetical protein K8I30_00155 [Anaerolineae bacterium]|nr:hypothetical protein [Anaerolineae bacterium]
MQKKSVAMLILGLLVFASMAFTPALAQETFAVYLFNGNSGELVRVGSDGSQTVSALGLEPGTYISSYDMAFTRDGSRLAFCATTYPQTADGSAPVLPTAKFYLRDIAAQNYLLNLIWATPSAAAPGARLSTRTRPRWPSAGSIIIRAM